MKGMERIGILTAIWKRHDVARIVLSHYAALKIPGVEFVLCAVGSEGEASADLAHDCGWLYVEAPNVPLSDKWNAGARAVQKMGLDALVVVGSDDLINAAYFEGVRSLVAEGCDFFSLRGIWYYDLPTRRLAYAHRGFPGAGTMISRRILEKVDYTPWGHGVDRLLDASLINRCKQHARQLSWIGDLRATDVRAVDIKTPDNMWDYDTILARQGEPAIERSGPTWMQRHFRKAATALSKLTP